MKRLIALLLVASSALAHEIVVINKSQAVSDSNVAVVSEIETIGNGDKGTGDIYEICYRGMLFINHSFYGSGGLSQVLDPSNGKPVQCTVKD